MIALDQVGIATTLVDTMVQAVLITLALALGLAFGLGGRETAGEIVKNWYSRRGEAAEKLQRTGAAASRQAQPEQSRTVRFPSGDSAVSRS